MKTEHERIRDAVEMASEEHGLASWYRSCAVPLVTLDPARYPSCCGGECEPCNELLVSVALRARELLRDESLSEPAAPPARE